MLLSAVPVPSARGCELIRREAAALVVDTAVALKLGGFNPVITHENGPYLVRLAELILAELGVGGGEAEAEESDG